MQAFSARRYAQAWDAAGGLLMSFTIANLDPWNAVELGALSLPLVFQVPVTLSLLQGHSIQQNSICKAGLPGAVSPSWRSRA